MPSYRMAGASQEGGQNGQAQKCGAPIVGSAQSLDWVDGYPSRAQTLRGRRSMRRIWAASSAFNRRFAIALAPERHFGIPSGR
jgi:hypothetical protein